MHRETSDVEYSEPRLRWYVGVRVVVLRVAR